MQLPASLTLTEAAAVHRDLQAAIQQSASGVPFEVDAAGLHDFDTSGLAVLLAAHRATRSRGQAFAICQAPAKLNQLAALYGVSELLGLQAGGM